jgi:hypothetical protein
MSKLTLKTEGNTPRGCDPAIRRPTRSRVALIPIRN